MSNEPKRKNYVITYDEPSFEAIDGEGGGTYAPLEELTLFIPGIGEIQIAGRSWGEASKK